METAEIDILPLTPDRLENFLAFFERGIPESEWGHRCYCTAFCAKDNAKARGMERAEVRREAAVRYVREGCLTGYLAYEDGDVSGWCNAGDRNACRRSFGVRWIIGGELPETEERAVSVFCFEVRPDRRGHHISTALLERVEADARASGCAFLEAYPLKESGNVLENYSGHRSFYEKHGFESFGETDKRLIMRKTLK